MATPKKQAHLKKKPGPKPKAAGEKAITASFSLHPKQWTAFDRARGRTSRGRFLWELFQARKNNQKNC